jgi:hypothetical protein
MAKFKIHKTKDYTTMSNSHFREKEMSLKAKGLLSLMLSLPEEWDYSEIGLSKLSKDGVGSTAKALDELEIFGYLRRTQCKETNGKFAGYEYDIFETPQINSPYTEKPFTEKPFTENQGQINTNTLSNKPNKNNKLNNTKELKKETIKEFPEVVLRIFNHWKSKGIYPREDLTEKKAKAIQKALKSYSEEEIISSIDRYSSVIFDKSFYFNTKWYIDTFMTQGNCLPNFTDNGERWLQYCAFLNEPKKNDKPEKSRYGDFDPDEAFERALERSMKEGETK